MSTIVVERNRGGSRDLARRYKVYVDNELVGRLWAGKHLEVDVTPGEHRVMLKIDWKGSNEVVVNLGSEDTAVLECLPGGTAASALGDLLSERPYIYLFLAETRIDERGPTMESS